MITLNTISCTPLLTHLFCGVNYDLVFLFVVPFFLIIAINELLDNLTELPREFHRKFGHILSGLLIIWASYHLGFIEMILFSGSFLIGSFITRVISFKSVHVTRDSHGTILYGLVLLILVVMWHANNPELVRYGIWILTVPDALAALIGSQWGTYLERFGKSYLGSFVFFVATCVVTLAFVPLELWPLVLLIALTLTVMEFFTIYGLDNLTLPILATVILFFLM